MTRKALCLSGGATRGTFQMGAIKCLYEVYGFRPDVISGTSVGAINGIKLACAPPPATNDSAAILAAVSGGTIDPQLAQLRALERFWLALNGRKDFFSIKPTFRGTAVETALSENASSDMPLGTQIDLASVAVNLLPYLPVVDIAVGIFAAFKLQEIKSLVEKMSVENSVADLSPVEIKLRDSTNINVGMVGDMPPYTNNLYYGTPLFMAMVALETGRLRYVTNKGEFVERDGVTPVVTALLDSDVDLALDKDLAPLSQARRDEIKFAIARYQEAVNQIALFHPELSNPGTSKGRKAMLAAATERLRDRGNYWAKQALLRIQGVTVKTVVRDTAGAPDPIKGALASASLPVLLDPPEVGVERYIDGGLREIIPIEIVLDKNVTQVVGILCSTPELPATDSMKAVGLIEVGLRAATSIAINEITVGDLATAAPTGIDTRIIAPTWDVHSSLDLDPSLIKISMDYGWLRAADEMQPVAGSGARDYFSETSELIARLRVKCLEIERRVAATDIRIVTGQRWDYFELRVNRWAIMHVVNARTTQGLPPHPEQSTWSTGYEREFRTMPPFQDFASVWGPLEVRNIKGQVLQDLWPSTSPSGFDPGDGIGSLEDAGSGRVFWMVRGAIFEDKSRSPVAAPLATVIVPNDLPQFLPSIPSGSHLMAETQAPTAIVLVTRGKKYPSPRPEWIDAVQLTGAAVALVPQGGLAQIPHGGVPYFLGNLTVVDSHDVTLSEVDIERVEQSNTTVDVAIHNRSANALTGILVVPTLQGITVQDCPASLAPNTIDAFTLRLQPDSAGVFFGSFVIHSSDALMPQIVVGVKFTVRPFGEVADLRPTPSPLVITAPVNSTSSYAMLTLANTGGVTPETVSASFEPVGIRSLFNTGAYLTPASFFPGSAVQLPIFFYPTTAGRFGGELVLNVGGLTSANHPYARIFRVPVVGVAEAATIRLLTTRPLEKIGVDRESGAPRSPREASGTSVTIDVGTVQPPANDVATLFILNEGSLVLEITTMLGTYSSAVGSQTFPIKIRPGRWTEVSVDLGIYRALGIGSFVETLRILSNDPVTPEAHVVITGQVAGAKGGIVPEFIDFGSVGLNLAVQRTTTFENHGTVDLHVEKIVWGSGAEFRLIQAPTLPYNVPGGGSLVLNVEFGPVTAAAYFGDSVVLGTREGITARLVVQARAH